MDIHLKIGEDFFVWDADKEKRNLSKHGIRFEEAAAVFGDPSFVIVDASRNHEARDAAIGFDLSGRLLFVVHIEVEAAVIRIISARRADPAEERIYAL